MHQTRMTCLRRLGPIHELISSYCQSAKSDTMTSDPAASPKSELSPNSIPFLNLTDQDLEKSSIILFPGQGAQFIGMGSDLVQVPKVKEMFHYANEVLRTNLLRTCLEGPLTKLNKTIHCQPAIYIVSLASLVKLQQEGNDEIIRNCVATAGFSVGEITALVFAGALTFEQGLHIIRVRAEAMQRACDQFPGAMTSVFLNHASQLKLALQAAVNHCQTKLKLPDAQCGIANYLYPECRVIAGNREAIEFVEKHAPQFGITKVQRIPVSGAFHTSLMLPAYGPLSNALKKIEDIHLPSIPVLSCLDAKPYQSVNNIRRKLQLQVIRPVRWEQVMHTIYRRPDGKYPRTLEVGPGKQLGMMLRMTYRKAFQNYTSLSV